MVTPQGRVFNQNVARELASFEGLILVCGRYEGIDERICHNFIDYEISIGDYVLTGGELAGMVIIDATARLIPGILGGKYSAENDSFSNGLLEYAQYTRPKTFEGSEVPEVLLSGNHMKIEKWRLEASLIRTFLKRKDVALTHYPVVNKNGSTITSAVTNLDLHDISRAAKTYGAQSLYIVTPMADQKELVEKIVSHWLSGYGSTYNPQRGKALELICIKDSLDDVIDHIGSNGEGSPKIVATCARNSKRSINFGKFREMLKSGSPYLLVFGTAWGLSEDFIAGADYILEPIKGNTGYNHLSVRSAAAIILDRLMGDN